VWIYTGNKFAKFHGNILSLSENIANSFRGATFFWLTLYIYQIYMHRLHGTKLTLSSTASYQSLCSSSYWESCHIPNTWNTSCAISEHANTYCTPPTELQRHNTSTPLLKLQFHHVFTVCDFSDIHCTYSVTVLKHECNWMATGNTRAPNNFSNNCVKPRSILISFGTHVP